MSGASRAVVWSIREDRTLSEHAKIAYLMLWSRGKTIWPSLATLGGDMGASRATAKRAIQELEAAGLVKKIPRMRASGSHDSNAYELLPIPQGWGLSDPTSGHQDPTPGVRQTHKDRNPKDESEGRNTRASRRARPAVERDEDKIAIVQRATIIRGWPLADLEDEDALNIYARFITDRKSPVPLKDPVSYLAEIFESFDSLDGVLSNTGERDPWA